MRVTPPQSLRIDHEDLLHDVRERLMERAPALAEAFDPTHPAWLLLQEAAWMVEALSERLDDYPWAVLRQFAHLLGAELRPAVPAMGVAVVDVAEAGVLDMATNPARWRFFAGQNEQRGLVEFALAEDAAPVAPASIESLSRLYRGELVSSDGESARDEVVPEGCAWFGEGRRSHAFARERFRYQVLAADADRVAAELQETIERYRKTRDVGWLVFEVARGEGSQVFLTATIDVSLESQDLDTDATDVEAIWGPLDDSTWTPPVHVSRHPVLPPHVRGMRPMRTEEGKLLVPDVPPTMLRNELLVRDARPAPAEVPEAIWNTLVHLDSRLAPLRPSIVRGVGALEGEPTWVDAVLRGGAWHALADRPERSLAHIARGGDHGAGTMRLGWVLPQGAESEVHAFALFGEAGLLAQPLACRVAWRLSQPARRAEGMQDVLAIDVDVPEGAQGVLLACDGQANGAMVNPLLLINAPLVADGRRAAVARAVPESVSLLFEDLVTRPVLDRLATSGVHPSVADRVRALRASMFMVNDKASIIDFRGLAVDPVEGTITFNAPDEQGRTSAVRRGDEIELRWYRRTQAELGNVGPGEVDFVEQAPQTRPRLVRVTNPLPFAWGQPREREEDAVLRVFGPQTGVPVTPADWERIIRTELGARADGWHVRVWGYAERTLTSHALWPPHGVDKADPERARFERELTNAGPEVLVVVLGPLEGVLSDADLGHARNLVQALVQRWSERVPNAQRALVTRLWPLTLQGEVDGVLPTHVTVRCTGSVSDTLGRSEPVPVVPLWLNAAVTRVQR